MGRESDFITLARQRVRDFWKAYHDLRAMQDQWNALDYANSLPAGEGDNAGIRGGDVGSAVFDTMDEVKLRIFDTAHKTNLARLL